MTTVLTGATVFTGDEHAPLAEAVAVDAGRILAVGDAASVRAVAGPDAEVDELGGALVAPGFVEAHTHLLMFGQAQDKVALREAGSLDEIRERLVSARDAQPGATHLLGAGWMFDAVPGGEPTAAMIDEVIPDIPVLLDANDLHSAWVNTAALRAMGIDEATPDPPGGTIVRDAAGAATGLLLESAAIEHAWAYLDEVAADDDRDRFLDTAFRVYLAGGVVAATDMALGEPELAAFTRRLERDGRLPFPVSAHWLLRPTGDPEADLAAVDRAVEVRDELAARFGTESFRIAGVKFILDGVIDACTAAMRAPYVDGSRPEPIWSFETAAPVAVAADAAGLQLAMHAIGDRASEIALDLVEECVRVNGPRLRTPRIEHLESVTEETIRRMAALGVVASLQPVHCDPAIMGNWQAMLGDERAETGFPWQKFREAGVSIALGTDAPTAPHEAAHNLFIALTTRSALAPGPAAYHPERAFTPAQALGGLTRAGAEAGGFDDGIGRIVPGGRANLVVLDVDPFAEVGGAAAADRAAAGPAAADRAADAYDRLLEARVLRTIVDGEVVSHPSRLPAHTTPAEVV